MSRLTLLMSLKGRPLHTLRLLWHANRIGLPYRILIADGQVTPGMAELLEAPARAFPKLDIEYVRFPDDVTYGDWYRKVASVTERIRTPYVMHAENDDFIVASGVEHCMRNLDAKADYASYGGGFGAFSVARSKGALEAVTGRIQSLDGDCYGTYIHQDYSSPLASKRIPQLFSKSHTLYYNVFRTPVLATIWRDCAEMNFSDLQVFETYFGARAKSLGKACTDRSVMSYIWQAGTSMTEGPIGLIWAERIREGWSASSLGPKFNADVEAFSEAIAKAISEADGVQANVSANEIKRLYLEKFSQQLDARRAKYQRSGVIDYWTTRGQRVLAALAPERAVRLRRLRLGLRAQEALYRGLRTFGASESYVAIFRNELAAIESTLEGSEFVDFVRWCAPGLVDAATAAKG